MCISPWADSVVRFEHNHMRLVGLDLVSLPKARHSEKSIQLERDLRTFFTKCSNHHLPATTMKRRM